METQEPQRFRRASRPDAHTPRNNLISSLGISKLSYSNLLREEFMNFGRLKESKPSCAARLTEHGSGVERKRKNARALEWHVVTLHECQLIVMFLDWPPWHCLEEEDIIESGERVICRLTNATSQWCLFSCKWPPWHRLEEEDVVESGERVTCRLTNATSQWYLLSCKWPPWHRL
ncbi:hypothetical protein J6590_075140 [Homalodisca vitripennis]|nr:hypothetical protein J6590_075140 [Homalodisca vitripennis]